MNNKAKRALEAADKKEAEERLKILVPLVLDLDNAITSLEEAFAADPHVKTSNLREAFKPLYELAGKPAHPEVEEASEENTENTGSTFNLK